MCSYARSMGSFGGEEAERRTSTRASKPTIPVADGKRPMTSPSIGRSPSHQTNGMVSPFPPHGLCSSPQGKPALVVERASTAPPGIRHKVVDMSSGAPKPFKSTRTFRPRQQFVQPNPFLQYDDTEKIARQKRRLLFSNDQYIKAWKDQARQYRLTYAHAISGATKDHLYDNRLLYCQTSHEKWVKEFKKNHAAFKWHVGGCDSRVTDGMFVDEVPTGSAAMQTPVKKSKKEAQNEVSNLVKSLQRSHTKLNPENLCLDDFRQRFTGLMSKMKEEKQMRDEMQHDFMTRSLMNQDQKKTDLRTIHIGEDVQICAPLQLDS